MKLKPNFSLTNKKVKLLQNKRGCLKSPLHLICQVEGVETDIDYQ
jgi:hypothetical protein